MRKIYLVPNFITTANLFFGFSAIIAAMNLNFEKASWFVIAAGVCDLLDGRIARMAKATSSFGVEYDSLADLISFGLAPSIILYQMSLQEFGRLGLLAAFIFMVCGALRLARFNVTQAPKKEYFLGLPTPAAAGIVVTFVLFNAETSLVSTEDLKTIGVVFSLVLGALMISNVPFPSFKGVHWKSKGAPGLLLIGVMILIFIAIEPQIVFFLLILTYVILSLVWQLVCMLRKTELKKSSIHESK